MFRENTCRANLRQLLLSTGLFLVIGCLFTAPAVNAQNKRQKPARLLPRVGTIKNYPATGMMSGCGNYYFNLNKKDADAYVFLARGDGTGAWMNLDGRDTRLKLVRSGKTKSTYNYRSGTLLINVAIKNIANDDDFALEIKITLKKSRSTRTIKAVGYADC